jgi:hypothetical protein
VAAGAEPLCAGELAASPHNAAVARRVLCIAVSKWQMWLDVVEGEFESS